jgi:hypothetical protein
MDELTPEQQQEFEFRLRLEQEQAAAQPQQTAPSKENLVNPGMGMLGGAVAGQYVAPSIATGFQEATKDAAARRLGVAPENLEWDSPGQRWARKTGFGAGEGKTVEEVDKAYKDLQAARNAPLGKGKIASKITGPMNVDAAAQLEAQEAARQARFAQQREAEAAALRRAAPMAEKLANAIGMSPATQNVLGGVYKGVSKAVPAVVGRGLAGGLTGLQGFDAWNRFHQNDPIGGTISTIGALGSLASMIPTPITRIGGTVVGGGAEALNAYLDSLKKQENKAAGGQIAMAQGGLVYLG